MLRATAVAYAVAALALAHLLVVLRLLWLDALAPPFGALLLDDELARSARTLVLMHHRRLPELNATLRGVAALPRAAELRVIVAQTVGASERAAGAASGALVRALAGELPFGALEHHLVVREAVGGAETRRQRQHGRTPAGRASDRPKGQLRRDLNATPRRK